MNRNYFEPKHFVPLPGIVYSVGTGRARHMLILRVFAILYKDGEAYKIVVKGEGKQRTKIKYISFEQWHKANPFPVAGGSE